MAENSAGNDKIARMMQSEDEEERLAALRQLDRKELPFALEQVYAALGDESWRVRKEGTEIFLSWPEAGDYIPDIIQFLYSEENAGLRNTAVEILTRLGRLVVPKLLEEAHSEDHDVRKFVFDILGAIPDERSLPLIQAALMDQDSNVRAAAAENLGKLGAVSAVPALLEAMKIQDLLLRFTILEALGQINVQVPVEPLLAFQNDRLLRKALLDCLGRVGSESAVPFLIQCLGDDMKNVREAAVQALYRLFEQNVKVEDAVKTVVASDSSLSESVIEHLQSSPLSVRRAAITLLGWFGDPRSIRYLIERLEDQELQEAALGSLSALGRADVQPLLAAWDEADPRSKAYLAYIFGSLESDRTLSRLIEGCSDSVDDLRQMSVQSLGKIGDATAVDILVKALRDSSLEVREAAMQGLTLLGQRYPDKVVSALSPLLEHADEQLRMYAVTVLGRLDDEMAGDHLIFAIKDESAEVRSAAIRAVEGKTGSEHLSVLMLALTDENTQVRALAARALGLSGDIEAIKPLELALQDEDMWVRAAAVRAIGSLNGLEFEHLIVEALHDPVGLVSISALETLEAVGVNDLMQHAEKALEHRDAEVVLAALNILQFNPEHNWLQVYRKKLLHHKHGEIRLQFAQRLAAVEKGGCCMELEEAISVEADEFVRQELQLLVMSLKQDQGR
ncbi:MAG: HEAT repeat domain-containing protein [Desulfuromonadales bacterium]|nr:HEAT repeat domain-containing protein [Desulfuromonadales bacterium]